MTLYLHHNYIFQESHNSAEKILLRYWFLFTLKWYSFWMMIKSWFICSLGQFLGGQIKTVFLLTGCMFLLCVILTITTFKEIPLKLLPKLQEQKHMVCCCLVVAFSLLTLKFDTRFIVLIINLLVRLLVYLLFLWDKSEFVTIRYFFPNFKWILEKSKQARNFVDLLQEIEEYWWRWRWRRWSRNSH